MGGPEFGRTVRVVSRSDGTRDLFKESWHHGKRTQFEPFRQEPIQVKNDDEAIDIIKRCMSQTAEGGQDPADYIEFKIIRDPITKQAKRVVFTREMDMDKQ